jgi:hypothetical protein
MIGMKLTWWGRNPAGPWASLLLTYTLHCNGVVGERYQEIGLN